MSHFPYPDAVLDEDHLHIGDASIPTHFIEGPVGVRGESGYFHRLTFTVFVGDLTLRNGAEFEGEPSVL